MNLATIILTKNEENNISDCIDSVKYSDEIIIIDDNSTDNTRDIALKMGATVYTRSLNNDYASQRNFGLSKAKNKWVLYVDADERVSKKLKNEIIQKISNPLSDVEGYYFKRKDNLWGKELLHGETANVRLLRLAKKKSGIWRRKVHEHWEVEEKKVNLINSLDHYPHQELSGFIKDINNYAKIHAESNYKEGKRSNMFKIVLYPGLKFIKNYFLLLGFLDGTQGFLVGSIMSMHSFLAWSNLWLLQKKK